MRLPAIGFCEASSSPGSSWPSSALSGADPVPPGALPGLRHARQRLSEHDVPGAPMRIPSLPAQSPPRCPLTRCARHAIRRAVAVVISLLTLPPTPTIGAHPAHQSLAEKPERYSSSAAIRSPSCLLTHPAGAGIAFDIERLAWRGDPSTKRQKSPRIRMFQHAGPCRRIHQRPPNAARSGGCHPDFHGLRMGNGDRRSVSCPRRRAWRPAWLCGTAGHPEAHPAADDRIATLGNSAPTVARSTARATARQEKRSSTTSIESRRSCWCGTPRRRTLTPSIIS